MNQEWEEEGQRGRERRREGGGGDSGVGRGALKTSTIQELAPCQFGSEADAHPRPQGLLSAAPSRPLLSPSPGSAPAQYQTPSTFTSPDVSRLARTTSCQVLGSLAPALPAPPPLVPTRPPSAGRLIRSGAGLGAGFGTSLPVSPASHLLKSNPSQAKTTKSGT